MVGCISGSTQQGVFGRNVNAGLQQQKLPFQHFAGTAKRCRLFRQNFVMKCIERMIQAMLRVKILRHS